MDAIITFRDRPAVLPRPGSQRDNTRPGLRTASNKKRTVAAFAVVDDVVAITGIFHGEPHHEAAFSEE